MTAPDVVIVRTPVEGTSAMPLGTPVLVASGYPQGEGWGKQVLSPGEIVGRTVGVAVMLALWVGFGVTVGRTMCGGVADGFDVDDALELGGLELGRLELATKLGLDVGLPRGGADERGTDGLTEPAVVAAEDGEAAAVGFALGLLLASSAAIPANPTNMTARNAPSILRLRNIERLGAGVAPAIKPPSFSAA